MISSGLHFDNDDHLEVGVYSDIYSLYTKFSQTFLFSNVSAKVLFSPSCLAHSGAYAPLTALSIL